MKFNPIILSVIISATLLVSKAIVSANETRPTPSTTLEDVMRVIQKPQILPNLPIVLKTPAVENKDHSVQCLARNIYYEARGEPEKGMIAVGVVTLNRALDPDYPDTVCEVVHQKHKKEDGDTVCQFSWVCAPHKPPNTESKKWHESKKIAVGLLEGKYHVARTTLEYARHYHSVDVNPRWGYKKLCKIGHHIFYD